MLDWLTNLARRRNVYVFAALVTTVAVVGQWVLSTSNQSDIAAPTTTDPFFGTDVSDPLPTSSIVATSVPPTSASELTPTTSGSSTVPPSISTASTGPIGPTGTSLSTGPTTSTRETDRNEGDPPNPGVLYPDRPDLIDNDQERAVGPTASPARLSGYSVWTETVTAEAKGPDGGAGPFLRIAVRIVNRDNGKQAVEDSQWTLLSPEGIVANTTYATPALVNGSDMGGNSELRAEVWFRASVTGRYWLRFRPDQGSARGIWAIDVT